MRLFDGRRRRAAAAGLPAASTLAIEGYDRLAVWKILARLPQLSQVEMSTVETYERAHGQRDAVLQKLHYLRSDEPLAGYDAMSADAISAALKDADLASIDRVRFYERRLRNRDGVLADIERARAGHRRPDQARRSPTANWG
jgi:hypothetical protein